MGAFQQQIFVATEIPHGSIWPWVFLIASLPVVATRFALPTAGAGEWLRPFEPCKSTKTKAMRAKPETRSALIRLCATQAEKAAIAAKTEAQGQTLTDSIRQRAVAIVCWEGSS